MAFFWSMEREPDSATEREVLDYISRICQAEGKVDQLPLTQEFVDYVNVKGCNVPTEVMAHLSPRMDPTDSSRYSVRASKLADILVQRCGYPIHVQVAKDSFLQIMSSFSFYQGSIVRNSVLEYNMFLLHMWQLTWARHPRVQDDFTNIHAHYQRVKAQGMRFPKEDAETVKTLNAIYESTTPEEEEQILNSIQRGKLQELVRRSEWDDRVKAQKIMRELLGASGSSKGVNGNTEPIMPYPPPSVPHPGEAEVATDSGAASAVQEHLRTHTQKLALESESEEPIAHVTPTETMSYPDLALPTVLDTDVNPDNSTNEWLQ